MANFLKAHALASQKCCHQIDIFKIEYLQTYSRAEPFVDCSQEMFQQEDLA